MADKDDGKEFSMNNFTPRAQQVLVLAKREAKRFGHNYVGTEHILLGLIKLGQGVAVTALQAMGLDLETVRYEVEKNSGPGEQMQVEGDPPITPRVKRVMELADKLGARFALIVGENEMAAGRYALKDMSTGVQESLTRDEIAARLAAALNC